MRWRFHTGLPLPLPYSELPVYQLKLSSPSYQVAIYAGLKKKALDHYYT